MIFRSGNFRVATLHRRGGGPFSEFDHLDATKADSRRARAPDADRPHGAESLSEQLLRRDRTGRVLPVECRAGHRLLERSPAAGPSALVSRHPAVAPGYGQFPPNSDQRAPVSVRQPTTRRAYANGATRGGWVAYEPNSLSDHSPRETPAAGFQSAAVPETGTNCFATPSRQGAPGPANQVQLRLVSFTFYEENRAGHPPHDFAVCATVENMLHSGFWHGLP